MSVRPCVAKNDFNNTLKIKNFKTFNNNGLELIRFELSRIEKGMIELSNCRCFSLLNARELTQLQIKDSLFGH